LENLRRRKEQETAGKIKEDPVWTIRKLTDRKKKENSFYRLTEVPVKQKKKKKHHRRGEEKGNSSILKRKKDSYPSHQNLLLNNGH
jgi:hypothetical protein